MKTPILFLGFNRPDTTARVLQAVRAARPTKLYIAIDGPRPSHPADKNNVQNVRNIFSSIDWPCELHRLFQEENLGCKSAVSSAISWFFDNESEGIIIEDDCLPHSDFFAFCEQLLSRYRHEDKVWCITGDNFQNGQKHGPESYYFSKYNHIWGWASWRRCWLHYDRNLSFWPTWRHTESFKEIFSAEDERGYWTDIFQKTYEGTIDTWDYQWTAAAWRSGGMTATPHSNLVTNIGMGQHATHIKDMNSRLIVPLKPLGLDLVHPDKREIDSDADRYVFENVFRGPIQKPDRLQNRVFKRIRSLYQRALVKKAV